MKIDNTAIDEHNKAAVINTLFRYNSVMSWVRILLSRSIITKSEYAKIDTMMAKKYGISSCSIFR